MVKMKAQALVNAPETRQRSDEQVKLRRRLDEAKHPPERSLMQLLLSVPTQPPSEPLVLLG